jgi:glycosyltransferase involved in cell wall biosynthesis
MPFFAPAYYTIGQLVKRYTKSKIGFLIENYISHENRWFEKALNKLALNIADAFICQSGFVEDEIKANHSTQPIHRVTLSVFDCYDLERYDQKSAREKLGIKSSHVVLFFGLIRKYKGLDKLIQSMKHVTAQVDNVFLLAVGEAYEDISYYEDIIKQEGIEGQSKLLNQFVENENIEPYFKAADVVVLPYNSASQSGILMMAYGFKKPVVVNNVGGLPELVTEGDTGYVTPSNTPEDIAKGVIKALQHPDKKHFEQSIANLNPSLGYSTLSQIMDEITGS